MALPRQGIHDKALAKPQVGVCACAGPDTEPGDWGLGLADQLLLFHTQEAIELDARNPLARYEKAAVLAAEDDLEGAVNELEALSHVAPGEASVYFQVGGGSPGRAGLHVRAAGL